MRFFRGLILLMLILVLSSLNVDAKENPYIKFAPKWSVGEITKYSMTMGRVRNGITSFSKADISITVVEKTKEYYTLEWKYEDIELGANAPNEQQVEALLNLVKGLTIRYTTDEYGAFQRVVNQDEVKAFMKKSTELVVQRITDEKLKNVLVQLVDSWLENEQFINLVVAKELSLFHNPYIYGTKLPIGKPYAEEVTLFNPLGLQQPLVGNVRLLAQQSKDLIYIEVEQELDKEKSAKSIMEFMNRLLKDISGKQLSEEQKINSVEIKDSFRYAFKVYDNWLAKCSITRKVSIAGQERIDTIEFIRRE